MKAVTPIRKVNIGCGTEVLSDWINVDSTPHTYLFKLLHKLPILRQLLFKIHLISERVYNKDWKALSTIIHHDVRKGVLFTDDSVHYIYTSHFLEHVKKSEAIGILSQCYRILKPNGWIRIVVPDLRILVEKYLEKDTEFFERFEGLKEGPIADKFLQLLQLGLRESPIGFICPGQCHEWMYDFESISLLLGICGFKNIERRNYREGKVPDIVVLDNRPEESLYVEAQK